jgi:hypothetical protein
VLSKFLAAASVELIDLAQSKNLENAIVTPAIIKPIPNEAKTPLRILADADAAF